VDLIWKASPSVDQKKKHMHDGKGLLLVKFACDLEVDRL
jgi:hypothetical protein